MARVWGQTFFQQHARALELPALARDLAQVQQGKSLGAFLPASLATVKLAVKVGGSFVVVPGGERDGTEHGEHIGDVGLVSGLFGQF